MNIKVSEDKVEVPLQDLLDITVKRLFEGLNIVSSENARHYSLTCKYGFDGTTTPLYKQQRRKPRIGDNDIAGQEDEDEDGAGTSDEVREYILGTFIVPLRLINLDTGEEVWRTDTPNSARETRPIRINFAKEDTNLCLEWKTYRMRSQTSKTLRTMAGLAP